MNVTELSESDTAVLQHAIEAADRLYLHGVQEVGAAVRTTTGQIFAGIHFETATGFANVCGEVAALCCMVAAGHRDVETVAAVWRDPDGIANLNCLLIFRARRHIHCQISKRKEHVLDTFKGFFYV